MHAFIKPVKKTPVCSKAFLRLYMYICLYIYLYINILAFLKIFKTVKFLTSEDMKTVFNKLQKKYYILEIVFILHVVISNEDC